MIVNTLNELRTTYSGVYDKYQWYAELSVNFNKRNVVTMRALSGTRSILQRTDDLPLITQNLLLHRFLPHTNWPVCDEPYGRV